MKINRHYLKTLEAHSRYALGDDDAKVLKHVIDGFFALRKAATELIEHNDMIEAGRLVMPGDLDLEPLRAAIHED